MTPQRVAMIPGVFALRAEYAGIEDPIAELRAAVHEAVSWLLQGTASDQDIAVYCTDQQRALAHELLAPWGCAISTGGDATVVLVIANGTACRTEKAPGFYDSRAEGFDAMLAEALSQPDPVALRDIDLGLGREMLADVEGVRALGADILTTRHRSSVLYDDDPYGVQYWVITWEEAADGH